MGRLFYGNFDAEYQWGKPCTVSPAVVQRRPFINRKRGELATVWLAVAEPDDCLLLPFVLEPGFADSLSSAGIAPPRFARSPAEVPPDAAFCPWAWTRPTLDFAEQHGWNLRAPNIDAVRTANSRRISVELETEFGTGLEGTAVIRNVGDLDDALRELPGERWVVKAEFGMSARERILGCGQLTESQRNWVAKRLQNGCVVLEPWVELIAEAGLQFTLPEDDSEPIRLDGVTPLLTDAQGVYRGSRFDEGGWGRAEAEPPALREAIPLATQAAERIRALGYFGPLGIDAATYRAADGSVGIRALQDINARHTMGRLSLGLRRFLQPGERGHWLHQRWPTDSMDAPRCWHEEFLGTLPPGTRAIRTSPFVLDAQPVAHGTVAVFGPLADSVFDRQAAHAVE